MNNKQLVVLFGLLFVFASAETQVESTFTVDQASSILHQLLEDAQQNLVDLRNSWEIKRPVLEATIAGYENDLKVKQEECAQLDNVLAQREKELKDAQDYAKWLTDRITENENHIKELLEQRCAQNGNYIEGLKNDKLALKLLQFLRLQVQNKESFSLAQKKAFNKKLQSFLALYKTGTQKELVQLEQDFVDASQYDIASDYSTTDRNQEEIGVGHVDNEFDNLAVDSFQNGQRKGWIQIQKELLELLQGLEDVIRRKMATAQEDEVASSVAAAEYKQRLEHEIEVFRGELAKQVKIIERLTAEVAQDQDNCRQCRNQEASVKSQLDNAIQDLADQTAVFNHKQSNFEEEVQIFNEVIDLYDPANTKQGDDFKERVEDFNDNQTFDNAGYDQREVPAISLMNGL